VTEAYKRRIVLPFAGPIEASDHVLGHELVHAFQYDITGTNVSSGSAGALAMPLWFIEGMAEYLSVGPVDPLTAMWMREATRREQLPTVDKLDNPKYFPYRYGQALWAYIAGKYGDGAVGNMLRAAAGRDATYSTAIESVLAGSNRREAGWRARLRPDSIAIRAVAPGFRESQARSLQSARRAFPRRREEARDRQGRSVRALPPGRGAPDRRANRLLAPRGAPSALG
jgi:hypothetical protein